MKAAHRHANGSPVDVMSAPLIEEKDIGQTRGRLIALLREEGWPFVAIGKLFRCSDRWVRAELRDFKKHSRLERRRREAESSDVDDEDSEVCLGV
jgi:hypothetical protein